MSRGDRAFVCALGVTAAVQLGLFLYYLSQSLVFGLFYDMADWLLQYAKYASDGDLFGFLWSPHFDDRVATTRLVLLADIKLFGGVSYPFVAASLACIVLVATALLNTIRTTGAQGVPAAIASFLIVMFLFNPALGVACSVPVYDNYPHVIGLTVVALHFFDDSSGSGSVAFFRRVLALLAGIAAGLASAAGLLIWPILIWAAWRGRLSGRWIGATAVIGCGYVVLYLHDDPLFGHAASLADSGALLSANNLRIIVAYFLRYMGLPWSHDPSLQVPAEAIGAVLTMLIVALTIRRGFVEPPGGLRERVVLGLLAFILGTAILASVGRINLVDPNWRISPPIKYAIFLSVGHATVAAASLPWLCRWWEQIRWRSAARAVCLLAGGLLIVQQIGMGETAAAKAASINASIAKFMAGQADNYMPSILHMNGGFANRAREFMRTAQIYDFRR